MTNSRFFRKKSPFLTLAQIIEITYSKLSEDMNLEEKIFDIATLNAAKSNEISFFHSPKYLSDFQNSKAGFCFAAQNFVGKQPKETKILINENPYFAYAVTASAFYEVIPADLSSSQNIHPTAKIGRNCQIASNAFIGKNVVIGDECVIEPSAVIMDGCEIGDKCRIGANVTISYAKIGNECQFFNGAQIGQDGFGYVFNEGKNHKILQFGIVEIGDNVEIGANSCIDRGALGNTKIASEVKIDNLCQIGHNVEIGYGCVIAGGCGVAGSTKIGNFVQIGGGCCIAGHIEVGDGVKIAGMSGVMRDIEPKSIVAGIPVVPITKWHRLNTMLSKMLAGGKE